MDASTASKQTLILKGREHLKLDRVRYVHRFDEEEVLLSGDDGRICVEGRELKVESLNKDTGELVITGKVDGIYFSDKGTERGRGMFGRGNR